MFRERKNIGMYHNFFKIIHLFLERIKNIKFIHRTFENNSENNHSKDNIIIH